MKGPLTATALFLLLLAGPTVALSEVVSCRVPPPEPPPSPTPSCVVPIPIVDGVPIPTDPTPDTDDTDDEYNIALDSRDDFVPCEGDINYFKDTIRNTPSGCHAIVQLFNDPDPDDMIALADAGLRLLDGIANHAWFAFVPATLGGTGLVRFIGPILATDKIPTYMKGLDDE